MTTTARNRGPLVLSPAQRAERARLGVRYSGIAALGGLFCLLIAAPYIGAPLSWWAIKQARTYDNPATLGVLVLVLNCVGVAVMGILALRVLMSA